MKTGYGGLNIRLTHLLGCRADKRCVIGRRRPVGRIFVERMCCVGPISAAPSAVVVMDHSAVVDGALLIYPTIMRIRAGYLLNALVV